MALAVPLAVCGVVLACSACASLFVAQSVALCKPLCGEKFTCISQTSELFIDKFTDP